MKHLRKNKSDLIRKKVYYERAHKISNPLFRNNWQSKFKTPNIEKEEEPGGKKNYKVEKNFKGELKKNYVSRILKNDLKTDGFPFWTSDQIFFPSTKKYAILLLAIFHPKRRNF